jgi:AcrR family transcriptional regulator
MAIDVKPLDPSVRRSRGRPRSDSRLEEVLACAAALFSARGYASTSLEDIAGQLGMTRAALYYYADSKEDLIDKCYTWAYRRHLERLENELGTGTGREMLTRFFLIYAEAVCDDACRCFLSAGDYYLSPEQRKQSERRLHKITEIAQDILARGVADGSLVAHTPRYALTAMFGAFNALHRMVRPRGPSPREMGQGVLDVLMTGLLPRDGG